MFTLWLPPTSSDNNNAYSYNFKTGKWEHISYFENGVISWYPNEAHERQLMPCCYYPNMPYVKRGELTFGHTFETVNIGEIFFFGNERFIKMSEFAAWGQSIGKTRFDYNWTGKMAPLF